MEFNSLRFILLAFLFPFSSLSAQFSGNALDFDGANDQVVCTSVPALFNNLTANDFTFEAWVYPRTAIFSRIFFAQPSTTNFATVSTGGTANIYFYVIAGGTTYSIATSNSLPLNQWTHVAARWTAQTLTPQVFFNGVLQAGIPGGGSSTGTSGLMMLGTRPGGFQYFPGAIDEARLWSEARSNCEIASNVNRSLTGPETNLLFTYNFNQGTGGGINTGLTSLPDLSASANTGTLTNFALSGTSSNWITSTASITSSGASAGGISLSANAAVCSGGSYTFPDGSTQNNITSPVTQVSTIPGPGGCDTLITTSLAVNPTYSISVNDSICEGSNYTFPDGSVQTAITASLVHTSNLTSILSCDSIIITNLFVKSSSDSSVFAGVCTGGSYTFPDGSVQNNITSGLIQTSVLMAANGCDSIIYTNLSVNPVYNIQDSVTVCAGSSYTFPDGFIAQNIIAPLVHTSNLQSTSTCDSTIVTTVSVNTVNVQLVTGTSLNQLVAADSNATYQWLDCDNNFAIIPGETAQVFNVTSSGTYAVAVTSNGCTDTSDCYGILIIGLDPSSDAFSLDVHPNPTSYLLNVSTGSQTEGEWKLLNLMGQVILAGRFETPDFQIDLRALPSAVYMLQVSGPDGQVTRRVVKD